jgi:hypothetical protein
MLRRKHIFSFALVTSFVLQAGAQVKVPVVGCPSDGQIGPQPAPKSSLKILAIPPTAAKQLAYYVTYDGAEVLGPRGWHCFGTDGSNGSSIYLSPTPITTQDFFNSKSKWVGITGYGIELSQTLGGTSGRFEVARIVARVFPKHRAYVEDVIEENLEPASDFPFGPYPKDKLTYKSDELVEFVTPAETDGLGTASWLSKNNEPIEGMELFEKDGDSDLTSVRVRLPASLHDLVPVILHEVEHEPFRN